MTATAGTAGRGYRVAPVACMYEGENVEYGERPRCRCGAGVSRAAHGCRSREGRAPARRASERQLADVGGDGWAATSAGARCR
jgi:hypothetical protein